MEESKEPTAFGVVLDPKTCDEIDAYAQLTGEQWRSSFQYAASVSISNIRRETPNEKGVMTKREIEAASRSLYWKYQ